MKIGNSSSLWKRFHIPALESPENWGIPTQFATDMSWNKVQLRVELLRDSDLNSWTTLPTVVRGNRTLSSSRMVRSVLLILTALRKCAAAEGEGKKSQRHHKMTLHSGLNFDGTNKFALSSNQIIDWRLEKSFNRIKIKKYSNKQKLVKRVFCARCAHLKAKTTICA